MAKQLNVNLGFTADTSQAAQQIQNLQKQLSSLVNQPVGIGQKLTADIMKATEAAAELKMHLQNATNVNTGTLDFGKLNQSLKASGTSLSHYATQLQSLGPKGQQAFMQLARSVANAEVPLKRTNTLLSQFGTTLANTARWQLSSTMLHGFIGAISSAWNYSKDLNESLNNIRIVTGKNIDEMSKFADQANRAAKALSTTTTAYTNASLIYYQQGLSDAEVLGRTETTIKLANVSRQSAEIVSDQMTAIWNNFYDGGKSLEYYADVVTALGAATASSSSEIATGLEKFAAVAETVGLSYEYATAALATVTATTRQSADVVGTAFKTLFARLNDLKLGETLDDGTTLGQYTENLAKVGVNIQDTSGQLKDMDTILEETAQKWKNLDKDQQVALAKGVAGIRQYTQFIALMDNWDFMESNLEVVEKSGGTLEKQAKTYEESWEAASKRVKASLETIYSTIMDDEFFIGLTNGFSKLIDGVGGFVKSIGGLKGVLFGLGTIVTKIFSKELAQGFQNLYYNIQMSSEAGRRAIQDAKAKEMQNFAKTMTGYDVTTHTGKASSQVYSEELVMQQQLIEKAESMTAAEQKKYQFLIEQHRVMGEQSIELARQLELTEERRAADRISLTGEGLNNGKNIGEVMTALNTAKAKAEDLSQISIALKEIGNSSKVSKTQIENLSKQLSALGYSKEEIEAITDSFVGATKGSSEMKFAIEQTEGVIKAATKSTAQMVAELLGVPKTSPEFQKIVSQVESYMNNVSQAKVQTEDFNTSLDNGANAGEKFEKSIEKAGNKAKTTSQLLSSAMSGLMSAGMLISSIDGLMDTLKDPDATGWEKFGRVLTSVSMIAMSMSGIMTGLHAAYELVSSGVMKNTLITSLNSIALHLNEKAQERKNRKNKEDIGLKTKKIPLDTQENINEQQDAATTEASAQAQAHENEETKEAIILEQARQKMGLSTSKKGNTTQYFQTRKSGKGGNLVREKISKTRYDNLTQQGVNQIKTEQPQVINQGKAPSSKTPKLNAGTLATVGKAAAGIAIIAAAVTAAALIIKSASDYYNRFEIAAQKAQKTSQEMQKTYETLQQAENEFRNTINNYSEGIEGLDKLTKGTEEYEKAVREANNQAIELLKTHKTLKYEMEDGLIKIDEEALAEAELESFQKESRAQAAALSAEQDYKNARLEADKINFQRTQMKAGGPHWDQDDTTAVAGGVGAGAVLAGGAVAYTAVAASNVWNPVGWAMLIAGAVAAVIGVGIATFNNDADIREANTLNALEELSINNGGRDLKEEEIEDIANQQDPTGKLAESLLKDIDATNEMIAAMRENTEAINRNNELIASQLLQNNDYVMGSENADEIVERSGLFYGKAYEEALAKVQESDWGKAGIFKISGANDQAKKIWSEYLKYAGLEDKGWELVDTTGTDENRIFKYLDENGQRQEKTLNEMQKAFAASIATSKTEINANQLVGYFKEWNEKKEASDQGIAAFLMNGNFENATKNETEAIQNEITSQFDGDIKAYLKAKLGDLGIAAEKLGYDNADALINAFSAGLTNIDEAWNNIDFNGISEEISKNVKISTAQSIENTIKLMNAGQLGKDAGALFTESLNNLFANVDPEKQEQALIKIAEIDWSQWNAAEQIVTIMQDLGYEVDTSSEAWKNFVLQMNIANGAMFDHAQALKDIGNMSKLVNDLSIGDIISKEDYDILIKYNDQIERYFRLLGDGTYKVVGDPLDLIQEIGKGIDSAYSQAVEGAKVNVNTANFRKTVDDNVAATGYSRSQLSGSSVGVVDKKEETVNNEIQWYHYIGGYVSAMGMAERGLTTPSITDLAQEWAGTRETSEEIEGIKDLDLYNAQIDFIDQYLTDYSDEQIKIWKEAANDPKSEEAKKAAGEVSKIISDYLELYPSISEQGVGTANQALAEAEAKKLSAEVDYAMNARSSKELDKMYEEGYVGDRAYNTAQLEFAQQEKWEGMDPNEVEEYADALMEAAENSELLDDNMSEEAAEDVALYVKKMNQGVKKLADGFEDWNSILDESDKSSDEYIEAMNNMKDAVSDVLGVSEEFITNDFIEQHMEDIEKAATGDADAIDRLSAALGKQIILDITVDGSEAETKALECHDRLQTLLDGKKVGFSVTADMDTEGIIAGANAVVQSAEMSVAEAQAYFNSLGYEPVFVTKEEDVEQRVPITITKSEIIEESKDGKEWKTATSSYQDGYDTFSGKMDVVAMSSDGKTPLIKELRKTSSGAMNNFSSNNAGGKSAGGSKSSTKKAKDSKKKKSDAVDRYKEINDSLEKTNRLLEKNSTLAEGMWGKDKIQAMKKNIDYMKQENKLLEEKIEKANEYLKQDREDLEATGVGFTFEDGYITNYTDVMNGLFAEYESKWNEFSGGNEDAELSEEQQKVLDKMWEHIETVKAAYEKYETTLDEVQDLQQEQIEKDLAIQQENFAVLQKELEIKLSINEDDLTTIEYYLSKMSDDFYSMAEVAALMIGDSYSGDENNPFGTHNGRESQGLNYIQQLGNYKKYEEDLEYQYHTTDPETGKTYINKEQYIEGLREVKQGYIDNLQALQELDTAMMSYYADTLRAGQEELAKYTSQMDRHNAVLEHYSSILDIIGKSKDFESMGVVLEAQAHTAENAVKVAEENYNMLRKQADQRKAEYEAELAAKGKDDPGVQMLKKQWLDAEEVVGEAQADMMQKTEEWAQTLKAVVENELEGLAKELEKAFTANFGNSFEAMNTQMERAKSLQEEYLTTTNQVYETNKLIRQSQQEIDKTTNSVAKRRLKDFINETEQLQNKNKLSKFELEIQQAKYDLLLAEIALEEAQNAKSTVRLQRDSEGNFGYVYTADQNAIAEAEQKFADAQNSLYNIGLEGANDYTEKYQQTLQEFYDTMTELQTQYLNGEFETEAEYQAAMMEAQEFYYAKLQEYSELYGIAVAVDANIVRDAWSTEFQSMTQSSAQWQSAITTYLAGVEQAFGKWETYVDQIRNKTIGPDLEALKDKTNDIKDASDAVTTSITKDGGLLDALDSEYTKVAALTLEYSKMRTEVQGVVGDYQKLIDKIDEKVQKESGYEDGTGTGTDTGDGSDTSGTDTGSDSGSGSGDSSGSGGNTSSQFGSATWERGKAAYDKINAGVWGNGAARVSNGLAAGFTQDEINLGQYMINLVYPTYIKGQGKTWEEAKKLLGFDTGGYTGDWGGSYGKLAMLHKKELVLNAGDTDNFLAGMEMLDNIVKTIDLYSMNAQLGGILSSPSFGFNNKIEPIEQNVHIEAHFPEATDRNEITEAINTLVNQASQFVNRK